jgi:hypothetical protein
MRHKAVPRSKVRSLQLPPYKEEKRGAGIILPDVRGRDDNFLAAFKRESLRGGFAPSSRRKYSPETGGYRGFIKAMQAKTTLQLVNDQG